MQVFKTFLKVVKTNKSGLIMYTCIVLGMIIALSATNKKKAIESAKSSSYTIYAVDEDGTDESKLLLEYIGKLHKISDGKMDDEQITEAIYYQEIACCIRIPEGFGESFTGEVKPVVCEYDEAAPKGIFVNMQINRLMSGTYEGMKQGKTFEEALKDSYEAMDIKEYVTLKSENAVEVNVTESVFTFLPFGIFAIIFSTILPTVIKFDGEEVKKRTEASCIKVSVKNIAVMAGVAAASLIVLAVLVIAASAPEWDRYGFTKAWGVSVLGTFVYTCACVTLMSLISNLSFVKESTVPVITNIIGLSFAFLGGTFVPLDVLGDNIMKVGRFTPNYWFSKAMISIYENCNYTEAFTYIGVIGAFALACLGLALMVSRIALDSKK